MSEEGQAGARGPGGRPPLGLGLVDRAHGTKRAKARLKVILQTLTGECSVRSACQALGIEETAFHKLRSGFLQKSIDELERQRPGRKPVLHSTEALRIESLERELLRAKQVIEALELREEISQVIRQIHRLRKKKGRTAGR